PLRKAVGILKLRFNGYLSSLVYVTVAEVDFNRSKPLAKGARVAELRFNVHHSLVVNVSPGILFVANLHGCQALRKVPCAVELWRNNICAGSIDESPLFILFDGQQSFAKLPLT